ncbi:MAG: NAD(P)/FAD-dependent oxidoreductase [Candidatus Thermoplasmatota archaeon]|nr:NAD(P)/FAD-dependent oxidoreductase [Candidatus Thermoplasmatota archaeon]
MAIDCDVLVVGGGPAGSSAARAAAKAGAKTILIEEHEAIGSPVQCAEGIGKYLIPFLPFKIPREQLIWDIQGMKFWADDILIERNGGIWAGHTINRKKWDQWLASLAMDEGARLMTSSKLIDLHFDDSYVVKKAIVQKKNKKVEIHPKVLIAADGVHSSVVDLLRVKKKVEDSTGEVKSFEMKEVKLNYLHHDQLFMGSFSPGAYAYIFPIAKDRVNVGVGKIESSKHKIEDLYGEFLSLSPVKKQVGGGKIVTEKSGLAPVRYTTEKWIYGNTLLLGDAANQNFKPFIEGILPACICGNIAGKFSFKHRDNIQDLDDYKRIVYREIGPLFKNSDIMTERLLEIKDIKNQGLLYLILLSNICNLETFERLTHRKQAEIIKDIYSWKDNKLKQYKIKLIEEFYLLFLSLWKLLRGA